MPRKQWFLILLIIIPVSISGCVIPDLPWFSSPSYEDDVIVITGLTAIPNEIAPGQQTKIIAYIRNLGNTPIPYQQEGITGDIEIELYDYCRGSFEINPSAGVQASTSECKTQSCRIDKILPQETKQRFWNLKANEDIKLKTICPPDGIKVRVKYPYTTKAITTITFMNPDEMERRIQEGTLSRESSYIALGYGPAKPYLRVEDEQPISTDSGQTVVALEIKNQGKGFVEDSKIINDANHIKIESTHSEITSQLQSCLSEWGELENGVKVIKLIQKKSPTYICTIQIPQDIASQIEATHTITTTLINYKYEFRDAEKVTIQPKI